MTRDETPRSRPPRKTLPRGTTSPILGADAAEAKPRQRIAKAMARAGLCSRRNAEAWILAGRVSVNGLVLTSPALDVGPDDAILVDEAPLPAPEKTRLFLFHKPRGLVTSDHDPEGRETVADFLRENWPDGPRVVTIGRLDINTEGLLLLTNDGGLARALELPQTGWLRRYRVRAKGETDQPTLDKLAEGLTIEGVDYLGIEAKLDRAQGANTWLTMGLREGKNREIKRVLEHIGLEVNRLIRLSFGPFQLLDLPEGGVEEVRTRVLRDQLGETLIRAAGVDLGEAEGPVRATPAREEREGQSRDDRGRRDDRRPPRFEQADATAPPRERPARATRRHVSTLRDDARAEAKSGPRRRVERSETSDARARSVKVERLVTARPEPAVRVRPRRDEDRSNSRGDRPPRRDRASPSALGKRERVARSGGDARQDDDRRRPARREDARESSRDKRAPPRREDARRSDRGREDRPRPPRDDGDRRDSPRTDKDDRRGWPGRKRPDARPPRKNDRDARDDRRTQTRRDDREGGRPPRASARPGRPPASKGGPKGGHKGAPKSGSRTGPKGPPRGPAKPKR